MKIPICNLLLLPFFLFSQGIQWQSFTPAIFEKAKKEKKPVLLHLAANWCHWCHVMEEKTYHNPKVVRLIQQHFVATTEDHDQRPDLANKYRDYGWPATIIYSPDGKEIFKNDGYIEPEEFIKILQSVKQGKLKSFPENTTNPSFAINEKNFSQNYSKIRQDVFKAIDLTSGGFKSEQKSLDFETFEYAFNHRNHDSLSRWLSVSLKNSLQLSDPVWGGIYQYSAYSDWQHPHYEKLLSVQARYIKMYLWYFYLTGDSIYYHAALKTYNYTSRFLKKKNNAFSNAQDADLIKGKKAHDYFSLPDQERIKLGIPSVDTNTFTDNNSKMAESLIYLYAYTGDAKYLKEAKDIVHYILKNRKRPDGFFNHGYQPDLSPAIVDQIYLSKALFLLFRTTGEEIYHQTAKELLDNVVASFFSPPCVLSFIPMADYLAPDCVVSENIEAARILNFYGKIFHYEKWTQCAKSILNYLLSDAVYEKIAIEPGILSLKEELENDPFCGLYIVHDKSKSKESIFCNLLQTPLFFFFNYRMTSDNLIKGKEELFGMFEQNAIIFCTSSFCSSPLTTKKDLLQFVHSRVLTH